MFKAIIAVIGGIILIGALIFLGAAFWTWLIMLAAGAMYHMDALDSAYGFWQLFPFGVIVSIALGALSKSNS